MIYVEDQLVKVNGVLLPGLVKSIEVTETAKIDEQDVEGSAVKPKQAVGYEDPKVNIELILDDTPTQTRYQRLATLRAAFRRAGQTVPQPASIVCEAAAAHGVEKVLFKKLSHKEESKKEQLSVSLEFLGYNPQTIRAVKASGGAASAAGSAAASSSGLSADCRSYLTNDRGNSPAADNASTRRVAERIRGHQIGA